MTRIPRKTEVVINQLEMLSGRGKEAAKELQSVAEAGSDDQAAVAGNGAADEPVEALVAM